MGCAATVLTSGEDISVPEKKKSYKKEARQTETSKYSTYQRKLEIPLTFTSKQSGHDPQTDGRHSTADCVFGRLLQPALVLWVAPWGKEKHWTLGWVFPRDGQGGGSNGRTPALRMYCPLAPFTPQGSARSSGKSDWRGSQAEEDVDALAQVDPQHPSITLTLRLVTC